MNRQHALLAPSSAHRWMLCAGSVALEAPLPEQPSEYSDEGTAAHELGKWCLEAGNDAGAYIGRIIEVEHEGAPSRSFTVDDEMARYVQVYVDSVREYAQGNQFLVEQSLPVGHITGEKDATGTGDAVILDYHAAEIQVHDLKFGKGVRVDADENPQLMLYGLGALYEHELLGDWKRVRLVIHQPRLEHLSEWTCTIEELRAFSERVKERASHAMATLKEKPGAIIHHLVPGAKQCRFCKAKATCPKLAIDVAEHVFGQFDALDQPKGTCETTAPTPADLDRLALAYAKVELIEEWCRAIAAAFEARLLAGEKHPDWKLAAGRKGNRAWSSKDDAEALLKSFRLKSEEMYERTLISPTTAETLLKKQLKRWKKVETVIRQADGKPTVVPASDMRAAIEIAPPADKFENLEEIV